MHVDADDLALVALGEGTAQEQAHVQRCILCRAEMESLTLVSQTMRRGGPMPLRPPAHVWAAIESAVQQDVQDQAASTPVEREPEHSGPQQDVTVPYTDPGRSSGPKTRFSGLTLLGAAAAGAVLAWLGTIVAGGIQSAEESVLASVELEALSDSVSPGSAQILERDGQRVLQVDAGELPSVSDGYLEVWLLDSEASGMVTIGLLEEGDQEFVLPDGLSTDTFGIVDVSMEHYDGDPTHSEESLWRGPVASP
ncbi:MAG: anti-sigma factor [Ornithinimicrobium sp.]|jgi:hypothetical protein|uniref:anti-sigma factor n=1 Tax=Ornithinimicrobium sp. TaxID=1977084 RepID=UPI003D9B489E